MAAPTSSTSRAPAARRPASTPEPREAWTTAWSPSRLIASSACRSPPAPTQILELLAGVSRNPWLLALWLGPVVWIGVALFEELARVFLLRRLWLVLPGVAGRSIAITIVSGLVGLVHVYQGTAAIVCIGIQSIFLGWFFLRTCRIRSLFVAHALYDSVQIVLAVVTIRQMGL